MSQELSQVLQQMNSYFAFQPQGKALQSFWISHIRVNPVQQRWKMELLSLEPWQPEHQQELLLSLCHAYGQEPDLLEVSVCRPTSVRELTECWPLLVEAAETDFHPEDPQLGEVEALARAKVTADEEGFCVDLGGSANLRHGELLLNALGDQIARILGENHAVYLKGAPAAEPAEKKEAPKEKEKKKPEEVPEKPVRRPVKGEEEGDLLWGRTIRNELVPIGTLDEESGRVAVEGVVFMGESRVLKSGKVLESFAITDYTGSISVKIFLDPKDQEAVEPGLAKGSWLRVGGDCQYDTFSREIVLRASGVRPIKPVQRMDQADEKRVELHLHTQMSAMDALVPIGDVIKKAAKWGHKHLAITDHGVVQAFPDAYEAAKKAGIHLVLGMEAYMVSDRATVARGALHGPLEQEVVAFDIETTGLDRFHCGITELGAVRMRGGEVLETFQSFVNPGMPIPDEVVHLTGITDAMVADAPDAAQALAAFAKFAGDAPLVAHNADFDIGFIRRWGRETGLEFANPVIDTLALSRVCYPHVRTHRLNDMAKRLDINMGHHHRANDDAATCGVILWRLFQQLKEHQVSDLSQLNQAAIELNPQMGERNHTVVLVKNAVGLRNLYEMVSEGHLHNLYRGKPYIPKPLLAQKREGLIVGSACEAGELYRAILRGAEPEEIRRIAAFYDYLELQPLGNNRFLVREGEVADDESLRQINRSILALGRELGKPVVATGDVHFLEPQDEYYRRILQASQKYDDADFQAPLYFRTTEEMLAEFDYLSPEDAREIVITNPNKLAEQCEDVAPLPPYKLYAPIIDGAQEEVVERTYTTAKELYGDPLPEIVQARLDKEIGAIVKYGFSVLYLMAAKLVRKSNADGYLVGSRGSVGSSLVARMTGITEINALPPHYRCPNCRFSDFDVDTYAYPTGPDLPDRECPNCGKPLFKDGYNTPFEVFLGFKGDKVPDIDLNFGGDYQSKAHAYTEVLMGRGNVYRAGTIGSVAEKTAYGYVKNYMADHNKVVPRAEEERLALGCTGVKRTTGQHPGGIIIVPKDRNIHDFCPIQYPADDAEGGIITTHFDFNSLHDRLVKLDILGHDDPTMLRMLQDLTDIDPKTRPLGDPGVLSLFRGTEALGVTPEQIGSKTGTLGIPEFGTTFVRQMLEDTNPTTVGELIRIAGLAHGTDVWLNNAQDKIRDGIITLRECIGCREDMLLSLIGWGVENKMSFDIMEAVRKGKGLKPEMEAAMEEHQVPEWFVDSCRKIKYLFPKAHAAAYVMMGLRVAWYKVYQPKAYYTAYYTVRADDFDAATMTGSLESVNAEIERIHALGNEASAKDGNVLIILELVREMLCRGIKFLPIDLYKSDATSFIMEEDGIRPPMDAIPGLGESVAQSIVLARDERPFLSVEDLKNRGKVGSSVLESLRQFRVLDGLGATNQVSLFDFL